MDTTLWIVLAIAAILVLAVIVRSVIGRRRTTEIRGHYGPEYEHTLRKLGSRRRAEAELRDRDKRVEKLTIRPLTDEERSRYEELWNSQQARFVDDPRAAVVDAEHLVEEVMRVRGYPVEDFEQQAADLSVDHPRVVSEYRTGHEIAIRQRHGYVGTEELRRALIHYRALFEDLMRPPSMTERRASA